MISLSFLAFPKLLSRWGYAQVSVPMDILIWFMIYPMIVQIDCGSIARRRRDAGSALVCF